MLFSLPAMVFGLVFAWPGGIPLTRALERLHPVSRPATYACAAVLCPLSVVAATIGGLFGPPGIWIYAGIVSLPAWLVLWLLRWRAAVWRRWAAASKARQGFRDIGPDPCNNALLVELRPILHIHLDPQISKRLHLRFHLGRADHPESVK